MNMIVIFIVSDFFYQVDAVTCWKKNTQIEELRDKLRKVERVWQTALDSLSKQNAGALIEK